MDDYNTPLWMKQFFNVFYDPCPINPKFDGLKENWCSLNFVNPPYSNPLVWVKKAIEESKKGNHSILLLRVDPSTEWYRLLIESDAHIFYCNERIKFTDKPPNFASMLVFI